MLHPQCESSYARSSLSEHSKQCVWDEELPRDPYGFAQVVTNLYEHGNYELLRDAFDKIEKSLKLAAQEARDFHGVELIEALQNAASWKACGRDAFVQFLGPESRRVWRELDAIWTASVRLDLADRAILEGEVLIWRMTRQDASGLSN